MPMNQESRTRHWRGTGHTLSELVNRITRKSFFWNPKETEEELTTLGQENYPSEMNDMSRTWREMPET